MINQFEVPMYLKEALPEIEQDLNHTDNPANAYQSIHIFLDYTFRKVKEHNMAVVKKCFSVAEKLYSKGNNVVKCAVENIFVFSLSHLPAENPNDKKMIMGLIPGSLYSIYMQQVLHPGL
ncbi:MAG TPA: hypothetical protein VN721_00030 [Flavipsychrobacter sp.]|nr:hypothetical protein [Flavipsychrobacter sp.]